MEAATFVPDHLLGPFVAVLVSLLVLVAVLLHMQKSESVPAAPKVEEKPVRRSTRWAVCSMLSCVPSARVLIPHTNRDITHYVLVHAPCARQKWRVQVNS